MKIKFIKYVAFVLGVLAILPLNSRKIYAHVNQVEIKNIVLSQPTTVIKSESLANVLPKLSETKVVPAELEIIKIVTPVTKPVVKKTTSIKKVSKPKVTYKKYTAAEIQAKICEIFASDCQRAIKVASMESGLNQNAISRTNDYGVFQINCKAHKKKVGGDCNKFLDVDTNLRIAKQIYDAQGWSPWTVSKYL